MLTSFITPFGRFCFNRLPMGLSSSGEHFQRNISQLLGDLKGVINLYKVDDILVYASTKEVHGRNLKEVEKII